ncbi:glycosyltransferase family 2 protein [Subsaximicrobium wynnwilliamsii]|uniref:Glycosyltransferase family 2 protein n=1 Tax=Subsaximicrobium wynnwilliamsii TaxID=291179 RepID=A0A5C6ZHC7_9FLAO|nr:glycosyltransferase family 2 protein [Subsaximicrobium wynnwilliamsii]TXD83347.1 glycosyltransferase family 2 protein [Subsaximicrobium wynnwilliamsii]TXD89116.1 glycosyltransferase family 2 protein [Subsaximicrobium wynnwilliamsii]TXE03371.1 glycosyltransferase family 2 protein [Subsaximicrobium wynnwilliamsii]
MKPTKDIAVVIPVFNEADNLDELYKRLVVSVSKISENYELLFVNDGSSDASIQKLQAFSEADARVFYIDLSRNFGHQVAVSAGLDACQSKVAIIIDSDLQDPPELIPKLYAEYQKGFNVVYAKRETREGETYLKKLTSKLFYRLLQRLTNFDIPLDVGDFRLLDAKIVRELRKMPEHNKFLRGQIAWLGFKQTHVTFKREARKHGTSGYSYSKMFSLAFDAVTGFSDKPLLLVTRMGFVISLVSFVVILFAMFSHFILKETITGWTSLIISSLFIGGIQLLSIGIIGEYISRISTNVKNRPMYVVQETNLDRGGE